MRGSTAYTTKKTTNNKRQSNKLAKNSAKTLQPRLRQITTRLPQEVKNFVHCSTAGAAAPNHHTGVPDGSCIPSFVRDHRVRYVIKPDITGNISFALQPGPFGALCLRQGTTNCIGPRYIAASGTSAIPYQNDFVGNVSWPQLPFPVPPTTMGAKPFGPTGATGFRLIACVANVQYTGSSMMDGGNWVATTSAITPVVTNGTVTFTARVGGKQIVSQPATNVLRADSMSGNMRNMPILRAVPNSYDYQSVLEETFYVDTNDNALFNPVVTIDTNTSTTSSYTPGIYNQARGVVFSASGLDSTASITVDLRVCIEYQIDMTSSPYQDLVGPSPPAVPGFLDSFKNVIRSTPVVELASAVGRYAIENASSYLSGRMARLH